MKHTCSVVVCPCLATFDLKWYVPGLWEWALTEMHGHVCGQPAIGSDFLDDHEIFMCAEHYTVWFKEGYREGILGEDG